MKPYVDMLEKHALSLMNVVRKDRIANGECWCLSELADINFVDSEKQRTFHGDELELYDDCHVMIHHSRMFLS